MTPLSIKGFACRCGPVNEAECAETMKKAYELATWDPKWPTTPDNFLDRVVSILDNRYRMAIDGIHTDQWSAITAKTFPKRSTIEASFWIECDRILDGFAMLLVKATEAMPEGNKYIEEDDEPEEDTVPVTGDNTAVDPPGDTSD